MSQSFFVRGFKTLKSNLAYLKYIKIFSLSMKIALVYDMIYPFSVGGVEFRNFSLAKELVLKGHEVHLFGVKMWKGSPDLKISRNFYAHGVSRYSGKYTFYGKRKPFEPLKYSFFLFFRLLKYDFDLLDVSAFPYFPVFSCKFYSILKRKPMNITWHEAWGEFWLNFGIAGFFGRIIEKTCLKLSKNNICVSDLTKQNLARIGLKNCRVIENWIDTVEISKSEPLKERYDLISVGRHLPHKNFHVVLKVVALLKKSFPKIKALILGEGPETINLLRMSKALGLEDNVEILGFTKEKEQMYSYLKSSKVFFLPSELEGFSIVSFEAMACGLPVITLDSGRNALAGYIKDGINGYVCKKNEIDIAIRVKQLLGNKDGLRKMSEQAIGFAGRFNHAKKVNEIEEYYISLVRPDVKKK